MFVTLISMIWLCTAGLLGYSAVMWWQTYTYTKDPFDAALCVGNVFATCAVLFAIWWLNFRL